MKTFLIISLLVLIQRISCDNELNPAVDSFKDIEENDELIQGGFVKDLVEQDILLNSTDLRIANGQGAPKNKFLDFVRLHIFINGVESSCGGSLIASTWVLTAARCVVDPNGGPVVVIVLVGIHDDSKPEERIASLSVIPHDKFASSSTDIANDIALIKLAKTVKGSSSIELATLAAASDPPPQYVGAKLLVCGYGASDDKGKTPTKLQWTTLQGSELTTCRGNAQNICTQWSQKDNNICAGDFGGPLYKDKIQVGITSFGLGSGCKDKHASGFTNVAMYRDWISTHMT